LVSFGVPGAFAAPFADSTALKAAVDNCIAVDPAGVACCNHGADCGAAGTAEMPYWDVSLVTSMRELFKDKTQFNADISRWNTSSVTTMYGMFRNARYAFNQHLSRWDVSSVTSMEYMFQNAKAFNTMPIGWDTSSVGHGYWNIFEYADGWKARFEGGDDNTLPDRGWTRKDNACDASYPPDNGDVGNCTDTLMSGTSCVPTCDAGYVLKGVTSCTYRVLTEEAVCARQFEDRAELKATVDACLDAVPSGDRCCSSDPKCWHPDPAMRRCGAVGCVDMPDWDVSQVTDVHDLFHSAEHFNQPINSWNVSRVMNASGMFHGASRFSQAIRVWTLIPGADTTGMFTGADTWLSRAYQTDGSDTTDGPPSAWSMSELCLDNERVQSGWCVVCGTGRYNRPGDDPTLDVDTECDTFGTRAMLQAAVNSCLDPTYGDPTGVACCSKPLVNCGAAGTTEMADWDVSFVTEMNELFYNKGSFNADISRWDTSSVTTMA